MATDIFDFTKVNDVISNYGVIDKIIIDGNTAWERETITPEYSPAVLNASTGLHSINNLLIQKTSNGFYLTEYTSTALLNKYATIVVDLGKIGEDMPLDTNNSEHNTTLEALYTAIFLPVGCTSIILYGEYLNLFDSITLYLGTETQATTTSLTATYSEAENGLYKYTWDISSYNSDSLKRWFWIKCYRGDNIGSYDDMDGLFDNCSVEFVYSIY